MTNLMRAVLIDEPGEADSLRVAKVPIPTPGNNEVRIKVAYCSMNPMDVFARKGKVNWLPINWPFIPGIEHSGVVDAVGKNGDRSLLGKRVHSRNVFTGNAEYSLVPMTNLHAFPSSLDWKTGTVFSGMTYTAYHVLHTALTIKRNDWCLFHSAAGPVGIMLTQIAKEAGARVIGLCSSNKFDFAKSFGADHLVDYGEKEWTKEVSGITDHLGCNIIVDGNQGAESVGNYEVVAPGGHIVYIGATAGELAPPITTSTLIFKSAFVGGFNLPMLEKLGGRDVENVVEKVATRHWKIPISEEVMLDDIPDLHARFERREIRGRAIIKVGGDLDYSN